jgi:mono/diheme cytochrome c family protein
MKIQPPYERGSIKRTFLKGLLRVIVWGSAVSTSFAAETLTPQPDSSQIRAGYDIAVTTCVACHVASPDQSIQPIDGGRVPSFQEIAKRPSVTLDSVTDLPKACNRSAALYVPHCSPFDRISDREWQQVAAYILSLRSPR